MSFVWFKVSDKDSEENDKITGRIDFNTFDIYLNDYYINPFTIDEYIMTLAHEMYHYKEFMELGKERYFSQYIDEKISTEQYNNCEAEKSAREYGNIFLNKAKTYFLQKETPSNWNYSFDLIILMLLFSYPNRFFLLQG